MTTILKSNIKKSIDFLNSDGPEFGFDVEDLTLHPYFYKENSHIKCFQEKFIGFYALCNSFRGLFLGINYLNAGHFLLSKELYGPSILSFYTSCFHDLHAFLALHSRVLIDPAFWVKITPKGEKEKIKLNNYRDVPPVMAILTKNNSWKFELRKRTHKSRWFELEQVFSQKSNDIPDYFNGLFNYMYRGVYQKGIPPIEIFHDRNKYRIKIEENLSEFLLRISQIRHNALYQSFGEDPNVVEALVNRDTYSTKGINRQADEFGIFSWSFSENISHTLCDFLSETHISDKIRKSIFVCVYHPWFDMPKINEIPYEKLRLNMQYLKSFLEL